MSLPWSYLLPCGALLSFQKLGGGGVWLLLKYLLGNSVTACFLEKPFESGRYRKEHAWRLMSWRESIHRRAAPPLAFRPKAVQTESTSGVCLAVKVELPLGADG